MEVEVDGEARGIGLNSGPSKGPNRPENIVAIGASDLLSDGEADVLVAAEASPVGAARAWPGAFGASGFAEADEEAADEEEADGDSAWEAAGERDLDDVCALMMASRCVENLCRLSR